MHKRTLVMDVKVGESISIDAGRVLATVQEKSGQRVKLRLAMNADVTVDRVYAAANAASAARGGVRWAPTG